MRRPIGKSFTSWRELHIGMVVYFSSFTLEDSKLFEWVIIDIDRDEKSIRVKPTTKVRGVRANGTKLHSVHHFVKTGELRKLP